MTDGEDVRAHYDRLAADWHRIVENRGALRDVLTDLLPPTEGRRVLDAGCGSGEFAARLAAGGADVVGVDFSPEMIAQARRRHGEVAAFRQADLRDGLDGVATGGVDVVVCMHALSHVRDLDPVLAAFDRVLAPGGALVVSTHHPLCYFHVVRERRYPSVETADGRTLTPTVDAAADAPRYGKTERFEIRWGDGDVPGVYYRRPLEALFDAVRGAGLAVEAVRELPAGGGEDVLETLPEAICLRAGR